MCLMLSFITVTLKYYIKAVAFSQIRASVERCTSCQGDHQEVKAGRYEATGGHSERIL